MEFSQNGSVSKNEGQNEDNDLIRSIVALSGLPDSSARSELSEILSLASTDADASRAPNLSNVSLDELRSAMLVYLETINADMMSKEQDDSSEEVTLS